MKHDTPSPDEAASELARISNRRQAAAAKAARKPEWLWWSFAAAIALAGLAQDLWPSLGWVSTLVLVGLAVFLVLGSRSKRIATAVGYHAVPDRRSFPQKAVQGKFLLLVAFLALCLLIAVGTSAVHVAFMHTIWSVVIAAVVVLVLRPLSRSLLESVPGEGTRRHR